MMDFHHKRPALRRLPALLLARIASSLISRVAGELRRRDADVTSL